MAFNERVEDFKFAVTEDGLTCTRGFIRHPTGTTTNLPALGDELDSNIPDADLPDILLENCLLRSITLQRIRSDGVSDVFLCNYSSKSVAGYGLYPSPKDMDADGSVPEDKRGTSLRTFYTIMSNGESNPSQTYSPVGTSVPQVEIQSIIIGMVYIVNDLHGDLKAYAKSVAKRIGRTGDGTTNSKNWLFTGSEAQGTVNGITGKKIWNVSRTYEYKRVVLNQLGTPTNSTDSWNTLWKADYGFCQLTKAMYQPVSGSLGDNNMFLDEMPDDP